MKTTILKQSLILLSSATLLAACGGDGGDSPVDDGGANPGESSAQALLYAYPDNGQGEVPTKAPIALRFTSAVSPGNVNQSVTLCCDDQGENLDFEVERVDGEPRGVLLTPTDGLAPGTQYTVEINDLRLSKGTAKDQTLTFTTRTLQEGPKSEVVQEVPAGEDEFQLSRTMPNGSELEPVMDFSAFRFQFTQPIDRATASYGDGNSVVLRDSEGAVVEAGLLVDGAYMTVDPTDDYLNPGETYTLTLGGLESTYGEPFAGETIEFTPKDSSPRGEPGFLVQRITQDGTSRLTGKGINQVPVNGTLLGEDVNVTQAQSELVIAELADVTQYTDVTPIRLPKGTLLEGTPIEMVKIGGEVDAGFGSGDVTMRVLSDATGYLVPNPYTEENPDQLRIVHLFMDVGIATENPQANGGFTQNLLHIHLVGVAEVDPNGGVLNIDATGMVEPDILGQEYGYGLLSFQVQSYKDQTDALLADARATLKDTTPLRLQSWTLGNGDEDKSALSAIGNPITLNFDEPLNPESVEDAVTLYRNDIEIGATVEVDGAALIVKPEESVQYSPENNRVQYRLELAEGISDISGNELNEAFNEEFELPIEVQNQYASPSGSPVEIVDYAPVVLATYPGYPCALVPETLDIPNDKAGRCAGGHPGIFEGNDNSRMPTDDLIPIRSIDGFRPITVHFHKDMNPDSIQLGGSFKVQKLDQNGTPLHAVSGHLIKEPRKLTFFPDEPWESESLYNYILQSGGYRIAQFGDELEYQATDDYVCDGTDAICGVDGLPLKTQPLGQGYIVNYPSGTYSDFVLGKHDPDPDAGGPHMVQYFRGGATTNNVLQSLRAAPIADTNGNMYHEKNSFEDFPHPVRKYTYDSQEFGPTEQPDPYTDSTLDPNGVRPSENSAKILIKRTEESHPGKLVSAINSGGCIFERNPDTGMFDFSNPTAGAPCPDHKFTYLHSALFAEVTDDIDEEKGLKVLIWPSLIMTTSININSMFSFGGAQAGVPPEIIDQLAQNRAGITGPQMLRMRYADNDGDGSRDELVEGWISYSEEEGRTMLTATVDLYLDAPSVVDLGGFGANDGSSNLNSLPITMSLTGPVRFLNDGRMVVEQYNTEQITFPMRLLRVGNLELAAQQGIITRQGSRLQYISDSIK
ncbi:MAG: hypothetical protein FH757_01545 [Alcanivorax sp.]|nr:hypothetical protein [Alcanivorax sp.]